MMHFSRNEGGKPARRRRAERPLSEISVTVWLTPENASFTLRNGLLYATVGGEEKRVTLFRQFPFDLLWEYVSVLDEDECELGIIRSISSFDDETKALLEKELKKRYYTVTVTAILSVKERFGFSYWQVRTEEGVKKFTLRDTMRSISSVNGSRVFFTDVDGNRYEIPDLAALDAKSRKSLELYV
jgi:hypothetical protein